MQKALFFTLLIPVLGYSQVLKGTFIYKNEIQTDQIIFNDSTFIKSSTAEPYAHGGVLRKGKFTLKNDTIYLQFEPWTNKSSSFEITSQERRKEDFLMLEISVLDINDSIIPQLPIFYRLKSSTSILAGITQTKSNEINYFDGDKTVKEIEIHPMGYRKVSIPVQKFTGTFTKLKVNLVIDDGNIYDTLAGTEAYYWDREKQSLHLINNKQQQKITFQKRNN